ncbi:MAG: Crp/Fnr family transcriptional regulator [Bradyrhizobiaceae bacterium]|nr:Crp/Fnr family transcriptional regulator [Bradyrhizobiaceae bacterium]
MVTTPSTDEDLARLGFSFLKGTNAQLVYMPAGTWVFREHEGCGRVGFVRSGSIRVFKEHPSGRSITIYRLGKGDACTLSMSCALHSPIHQASAIVEEDAEVYTLGLEEFQHLLDKNREARDFVLESFAARLTDTMLLVEEVVFQKMDERLAAVLLEHGMRLQTSDIAITHEQLAEETGTAREVVTRLLHDFSQRGFVALSRGNVKITDRKALARACSQHHPSAHA